MKRIITCIFLWLCLVITANAQTTKTSSSYIKVSEFGIYLPIDTTSRIQTEFRCDNASRLILVFRTQNKTIAVYMYDYDEAGNRTKQVTMSFLPDPKNPDQYYSHFNKAEFEKEKEKMLRILKTQQISQIKLKTLSDW